MMISSWGSPPKCWECQPWWIFAGSSPPVFLRFFFVFDVRSNQRVAASVYPKLRFYCPCMLRNFCLPFFPSNRQAGRLPALSPFVLRTSVTSIADAKRRRALVRRARTERRPRLKFHSWEQVSRFEQGVLEQYAWTLKIQIDSDFPSFERKLPSWQVELQTLQAVVQIY